MPEKDEINYLVDLLESQRYLSEDDKLTLEDFLVVTIDRHDQSCRITQSDILDGGEKVSVKYNGKRFDYDGITAVINALNCGKPQYVLVYRHEKEKQRIVPLLVRELNRRHQLLGDGKLPKTVKVLEIAASLVRSSNPVM